ncbi:hypothetical protein AB1N83_008418 [Pleurotus pulmonarius]
MTTFTESFQPETGCLSLALFLTAILYGVSLLLIGLYFLSPARPNDSVFVKCTVAFLSILGTAEMLCLFVGIEIKMLNPSTPNQVFALPLGEMVFMVSLMALVAQLFFATRIWIVSNSSWHYVGPITLLAFIQFAVALAQIIIQHKLAGINLFHSSVALVASQTSTTAAADILITVGLCRTLQSSRSGIGRTDVVVAKLIRYSIHRGAATSVAAVLTVLFVTTMPSTALMVPLLVSGQLYVISVVSMLLNRSKLRDLLHGNNSNNIPSATISSRSAA